MVLTFTIIESGHWAGDMTEFNWSASTKLSPNAERESVARNVYPSGNLDKCVRQIETLIDIFYPNEEYFNYEVVYYNNNGQKKVLKSAEK